jgi:hypothetical protein
MREHRYYIVLPDGSFCSAWKEVRFYALPDDSEEVREIEESGKFPKVSKVYTLG